MEVGVKLDYLVFEGLSVLLSILLRVRTLDPDHLGLELGSAT